MTSADPRSAYRPVPSVEGPLCADSAPTDDRYRDMPRVSINASPRQLASGLVSDVAQALSVTEAPPDLLCIELTETGLLSDTDSARASMSALADLGVVLSLDDFGTGYSSLSYLQTLPLTELKVDKSFVSRCDTADCARSYGRFSRWPRRSG